MYMCIYVYKTNINNSPALRMCVLRPQVGRQLQRTLGRNEPTHGDIYFLGIENF